MTRRRDPNPDVHELMVYNGVRDPPPPMPSPKYPVVPPDMGPPSRPMGWWWLAALPLVVAAIASPWWWPS